MGERRGVYRVLVGKNLKERGHLEGISRRWKDNIKMDLQEVGCGGMEWMELVQDRITCECGNETSVSIKCGKFFLLAENRLNSQEGLCSMVQVSKRHRPQCW